MVYETAFTALYLLVPHGEGRPTTESGEIPIKKMLNCKYELIFNYYFIYWLKYSMRAQQNVLFQNILYHRLICNQVCVLGVVWVHI